MASRFTPPSGSSFRRRQPALRRHAGAGSRLFEMQAGETCVLFGAAGSGKTTLLKAALGLVEAGFRAAYTCSARTSRTSRSRSLFDIRARVGILFQEGGLVRFADHRGKRRLSAAEPESAARPASRGQAKRPLRQDRGRSRAGSAALRRTGSDAWKNSPASFPEECAAASESRARW